MRSVKVGRKKADKKNCHNLEPAKAADEESAFYSRQFLIRYADEEVVMNDFCNFRTEVEIAPDYQSTDFFIETALYWANVNTYAAESIKLQLKKAEVRKIGRKILRIPNLLQGVFQYYPVVYVDENFCVTNCTLHSIVLEHKFKLLSDPHDLDRSFVENGINVVSAKEEQANARASKRPKEVPPRRFAKNLKEYMFPDTSAKLS